ncbi:aromatic acid exporter family protein [Listeria valentina]|uniref:aromatic acid exporter family protein n=1 Tax=Listeria valentina TaxID=2705293 RepID=UPI00143159CF|nr:aromatic acid exporter family protein [Listeria valentina]
MKLGMRTLKTAFGATLAILIAEFLKLDYAVSAGVITVLSIQNTKKSSLLLAIQRVYSTVLALSISAILFLIFGYNAISFGLYLLLFIPLAVRLKVTDGIVVSSVLVTHILVEKSLALHWFVNEMALMIVGAGIAILLNLYMPKLDRGIRADQKKVELLMRQILFSMAQRLRGEEPYLEFDHRFDELKQLLQNLEENAVRNMENSFLKSSPYFLKYVDMRLIQFRVLTQMKRHSAAFQGVSEPSQILSRLTEKTALELSEDNPAEELVMGVTKMVHDFRKSELPVSREEFENRAVLFQFMNDLRYFLEIKRDFYVEFQTIQKEKVPE